MVGFLFRAALTVVGLWIATYEVHGIRIDTAATLLLAGLLLGVVNAIVRPIAVILTFPLTILTLGLFLLVINALMLELVAAMLDGVHIASFRAAFWAALIVSITGWVGSWLIGPRGKIEVYTHRGRPPG
ncbi:MAG TPA: phage holin family protein [Steroidobacteraceae bacterium]|nr:phage holin family protein [Steroidobacteraceae bacterium]